MLRRESGKEKRPVGGREIQCNYRVMSRGKINKKAALKKRETKEAKKDLIRN